MPAAFLLTNPGGKRTKKSKKKNYWAGDSAGHSKAAAKGWKTRKRKYKKKYGYMSKAAYMKMKRLSKSSKKRNPKKGKSKMAKRKRRKKRKKRNKRKDPKRVAAGKKAWRTRKRKKRKRRKAAKKAARTRKRKRNPRKRRRKVARKRKKRKKRKNPKRVAAGKKAARTRKRNKRKKRRKRSRRRKRKNPFSFKQAFKETKKTLGTALGVYAGMEAGRLLSAFVVKPDVTTAQGNWIQAGTNLGSAVGLGVIGSMFASRDLARALIAGSLVNAINSAINAIDLHLEGKLSKTRGGLFRSMPAVLGSGMSEYMSPEGMAEYMSPEGMALYR